MSAENTVQASSDMLQCVEKSQNSYMSAIVTYTRRVYANEVGSLTAAEGPVNE